MENLQSKTVAEMVTENIKTAHIFKKHGIDFCCGGGISLDKACEKYNVDYNLLTQELLNVDQSNSRATNYNRWELDFLTDHIINVHHAYVEENIPLLLQYSARVAQVHGSHYTELLEIKELVKEVAGELSAHLKKEELILFPFIKQMVRAKKENTQLPVAHFGSVDNPIKMMETEHEDAGELLRRIAKLSNNYTPPQGACNTYKAYYAKLEEFEQDLHQHVHLENNILFPKSLLLEKELRSNQ
ncbi:iron-sulfur cluster repair di-iron protein [Salinimicrobium sp. MT39]|uniref:Iron-sulfur cluster repair di-iron protein n=1 Tax=Salinimicrobium profundisediminis TaxID=2994553 RepID=A0A9X3CUX4_9FLAO|nr:iron-sulfur cluster repair di-iron protein [Salinimicrobium profundisediminis]MCX2837178.1 iron-sulfur cluster repair di-iron protein [Salinimicrobium profundisediminis]